MRRLGGWIVLCAAASIEPGLAQEREEPLAVWMDVDTAVMPGGHEIDDGLALVFAFHSPELAVRGVSSVFGNAPLEKTDPITKEIAGRFGPRGLAVARGAASHRDRDTEASRALAAALEREPLTILALGPVTNVAAVVAARPDLHERIRAIVAVAGRRPGQRFVLGEGGTPLRDLNFELDPEGFRVLLESSIPLVLAPFEVGSKVPLTDEDVDGFAEGGKAARYFVPAARDWLGWYEERFGLRAFYPWDTLAVGYAIDPSWLRCEELPAEIQVHDDDVGSGLPKPYLVVSADLGSERRVTYCYDVAPRFARELRRRLLADR